MQEEYKKNTIDHILESIKKGELKMRPKWHFMLKTVLLILGSVILALSLFYLISLIIFGLRETGVIFTPGFGVRGTIIFLRSLPWLLILLVGIFLVILEILVRSYSFAYKTPLVYSAALIVLIAFVGGWIVARTPLHTVMIRHVPEFNIPLVGGGYPDIRRPMFKEVHTGRIIVITPRGFDIQNPRNEMFMVIITPQTQIKRDVQFHAGDRVMIMGPRFENEIRAMGVRKISE
ncbi:MAG: hypothetical protein KBD29_00240 [Candidatus Magasanikbacteria bacterium]|nr:hypothetical protein [Candidatus Magasanikbacteria bacterium]